MQNDPDSAHELLKRWELEGVVLAMILGGLAGGLVWGAVGLLLGTIVLGVAMRLVQQKRKSPLLPEAARASVWLPVLAVTAGAGWVGRGWAMVRRRVEEQRSGESAADAATEPVTADGRMAETEAKVGEAPVAAPVPAEASGSVPSPASSSADAVTPERISGGLFGLVLVSFFMTFVTVSCMGETVKVSGIETVTGVVVQQSPLSGATSTRSPIGYSGSADTESFGIFPKLAFGAAAAGLLFSFAFGRTAMRPAICGAVGVVTLLIFRAQLMAEARDEGVPNLVDVASGFWLAVIFFSGAALYNGWRFMEKRRRSSSGVSPQPPHPTPSSEGAQA
jgi:hypothetical protein